MEKKLWRLELLIYIETRILLIYIETRIQHIY